MAHKILFKRGYKAALESKLVGANIPSCGEPVYEIPEDGGVPKLKIGDGVRSYAELPYIGEGSGGLQQVVFGSRYEFPSVGDINKLYIAKDEYRSYIWDTSEENNYHYSILGVETREIDGGGASTW